MKSYLPAFVMALCMLCGLSINEAVADNVPKISRSDMRSPVTGSVKIFTGKVTIEPLFTETPETPFGGAYLTFEPGSRTFWHSHPYGQHLIVTSGTGKTGYRNGIVQEIRAGDVIWCPPGVEHWHGAVTNSAMTHLAITGIRDGKNHEWKEEVTDEHYLGQ